MSDEISIEVPTVGVNLDSIAGDLIDSTPEVQTHVVEQHKREQAGAPTDSDGVAFDAKIHSSDPSGNGIKTSTGKWRKKRGVKAAAATSKVGSATASPTPTVQQQAARTTGIAITQMMFVLGQALGGAEWAPRQVKDEKGVVVLDETAMMNEAHIAFCEAHGIDDVPPGVALAFAYICYAAPRFAMPETKARTKKFRTWFTLQVTKWKVKRELKKRGIKAKVEVRNGELLVDGVPTNE